MAKKLIVANWKMNPETSAEAVKIAEATLVAQKETKIAPVVCPPAVFLPALHAKFGKGRATARLAFGIQNISSEKVGAHTGEVSAGMALDAGAAYTIIGHSERRALGETDAQVQKKIEVALRAGLLPIVCIGERSRDEHGEYLHVLEKQIVAILPQLPKKYLEQIVIAYEPLWAIGEHATKAATPEEVFSTVIFIRKILTGLLGKDTALAISVIYGGSVDAENTQPMLEHGGVQGLLVGRESINPKNFTGILNAVRRVK